MDADIQNLATSYIKQGFDPVMVNKDAAAAQAQRNAQNVNPLLNNVSGAPDPQTTAPTTGNAGNWITHAIPTAALIGGTMLAAPLTGGLDIIPALAAAGVIGAGSQAAGKVAENMVEKKAPKDLLDNVGGQAFQGALGGAGGEALGRGASALIGKVLGSGATDATGAAISGEAAQRPLEAAANAGDYSTVGKILNQIPADDPYKSSMETLFRGQVPVTPAAAGDILTDSAGNAVTNSAGMPVVAATDTASPSVQARMLNQSFNTPAKLASRINPLDTLQEWIQQGLPTNSLDAMQTTADNTNNVLGNILDKAVGKTGTNVSLNGIYEGIQNAVDEGTVSPENAAAVKDDITRILGPNIGDLTPSDALAKVRQINQLGFRDYFTGQSALKTDPVIAAAEKSPVYLSAANGIEDALTNAMKDSGSLDALKSPEVIDQLQTISPRLAQQAAGAQDVGDFRSLMKNATRVSQMVDLTKQAGSTVAGNTVKKGITGGIGTAIGGLMGGPIGAAVGGTAGVLGEPLVDSLMQSSQMPVTSAIGKAITGASGVAGKVLDSAVPRIAGNLIGEGAASIAMPGATPGATPTGTSGGDPLTPGGAGTPGATANPSSDLIASDGTELQPYTRADLVRDLELDLQRTGGAHKDALLALYQASNPTISQSQQDQLLGATSASGDVSNLQTLFNQTNPSTNGLGAVVAGHVKSLQTLWNGNVPASTYTSASNAFLAALSKDLGNSSLRGQLLPLAQQLIPKLTDSQSVANAKFNTIYAMINANQAAALSVPQTNSQMPGVAAIPAAPGVSPTGQ